MRSRTKWDWRLIFWPIVALGLALILAWPKAQTAESAERESLRGITAVGWAYWCYPNKVLPKEVLEACVLLTMERR